MTQHSNNERRTKRSTQVADLFWFSGTLSFDVFELVSKSTKDLRQFFFGMGASRQTPRGFARPLQDNYHILFARAFADFPTDDDPTITVQDADQVVERACDVQIRHIDVPVLVGGGGLNRAGAFQRRVTVIESWGPALLFPFFLLYNFPATGDALFMARPLRIEFAGAIYLRDGFAQTVTRYDWELLTFVDMPNHVHLFLLVERSRLCPPRPAAGSGVVGRSVFGVADTSLDDRHVAGVGRSVWPEPPPAASAICSVALSERSRNPAVCAV